MKSYDTIEEIRSNLTNLGFTEYKPTPFDSSSTQTCFQKRYDDEVGKKYFIDAKVIDFTFTDRVPENYVVSFSGQYYQKDTHNAVNMDFIDWDLEQIEKFLDEMFAAEFLEHYETWEDL